MPLGMPKNDRLNPPSIGRLDWKRLAALGEFEAVDKATKASLRPQSYTYTIAGYSTFSRG